MYDVGPVVNSPRIFSTSVTNYRDEYVVCVLICWTAVCSKDHVRSGLKLLLSYRLTRPCCLGVCMKMEAARATRLYTLWGCQLGEVCPPWFAFMPGERYRRQYSVSHMSVIISLMSTESCYLPLFGGGINPQGNEEVLKFGGATASAVSGEWFRFHLTLFSSPLSLCQQRFR